MALSRSAPASGHQGQELHSAQPEGGRIGPTGYREGAWQLIHKIHMIDSAMRKGTVTAAFLWVR